MTHIALAIHGGAGTLRPGNMTPEKEQAYRNTLKKALDAGYALLQKGASALAAVEAAVIVLEDSPLFNAGKGSVFAADGSHEMDASIMEGTGRQAGAVAAVKRVKNPIALARQVLEQSEHVMLVGAGAEEFARLQGFDFVDQAYFFDEFRYNQWQKVKGSDKFQLDHSDNKDHKFGTVGAVALDQAGCLAAATSTGGMTNKRFGRVGDSPIIGSGTYANNDTCAVSCTGSGEYFIRGVVAFDVSCQMEYKGLSLQEASEDVVMNRLLAIDGDGGLIAVDKEGNIAMPFNTEGMYRASISSKSAEYIAIYK